MGRPSTYTPEIADAICERIAAGESLRAICEEDGAPDRKSVLRWLDADADFAAKYARAREHQADAMDDRILSVAERTEAGALNPKAARVVIGALQWRAAKLKPKVYGEKIDHSVSGEMKHYFVESPPIAPSEQAWIESASGGRSPDRSSTS